MKRAVTLVEILVVMLIFSLLLIAVLNLMNISSQRVTQQEQSVVCTTEASTVIALLRRDAETMTASATGPIFPVEAAALAVFRDGALVLRAEEGAVTYQWNEREKDLLRFTENRSQLLARGLVTKFFASFQMLGSDGVVRSFPPDPEAKAPEPAMPVPAPRVIRCWVKVFLTLEQGSPGKGQVKQEYVFRLFPVGLNRGLHSIWLPRAF